MCFILNWCLVAADDTQLYIKHSSKDIVSAKSRLLACFSDIQTWCASMRQKLNASKTELILFNRLPTPPLTCPILSSTLAQTVPLNQQMLSVTLVFSSIKLSL